VSFQPLNPATEEALPALSWSSSEEIDGVVARARAAQPAWAALSVEQRAEYLRQFAAKAADPVTVERLARSVTQEMGKPIRFSRAEAKTMAARVEGFVERAREAAEGETTGSSTISVEVEWRPLGVAAVIAPWNYPLSTPNNLVLSALLTGNTVVLKPSEFTPRTGAIYCDLLAEALPTGVMGVIQGGGSEGAHLVKSDVDIVAFTGSIATGQAIMRAAAETMTRLVLELGGKDSMIVLPGADLDAAAKHAAEQSLRNSGQVCVSVERVLVHTSISAELERRICAWVKKFSVGDPMLEETEIGPMVSVRQRQLVLDQLDEARSAGARFLISGEIRGPGFFLTPSVVADVTDAMRLGSDETFGPVVALSTVADADEAVRQANGTCYGLGASVWGREGPELDDVAARIDAGMIGINRGLSAAGGAPWVGWKQSGFGYTRSTAGMRQFMQPRTVARDVLSHSPS